jgi:hypothetical protein
VTFYGEFRAAERVFLARQFGGCSFRLIARSPRDPALAVAKWRPDVPGTGGGPAPLFGPPSEAAYVLDTRAAPPALVRVDGDAELAERFPGHFDGVRLQLPVWDRVRRRVRGLLPPFVALGSR